MPRSAPLLFCIVSSLFASPAWAKAQSELGYRIDEVFSTAVRYVRVDRGCKITDKDADAAFVIFECPLDEKHTGRGAVEIFRAMSHGKEVVRLSVSLPDEGHGMELRALELIERKLREDRGTPPKPSPPPVPTSPDGGVR